MGVGVDREGCCGKEIVGGITVVGGVVEKWE